MSYKDEMEKAYQEAFMIIDKGFVSVFSALGQLITRLDLLEYVVLPMPANIEFTLLNNNNVHHLFTVNDIQTLDHIVLRTVNESILVQTAFIKKASSDFIKYVIFSFLFFFFSI